MKLEGSTVVVTGGASGLGEAVVRNFAKLGAKVAILDMNIEKGQQLAHNAGGCFYQVDITDKTQLINIFEKLSMDLGDCRVLVNCAGISAPPQRIVGLRGFYPEEQFKKIIDVNITGCFLSVQIAAEKMMSLDPLEDSERGVIINISSIAGLDSPAGTIAYNASKAAVHSMTLTMARDLAPWGIRVCAIAPGSFDTPMMDEALADKIPEILDKIPFPNEKLADPEYFALLAEHLVRNPLINGETVRIDGAARLV